MNAWFLPFAAPVDRNCKQVTSDIFNGWSGKLFVGEPLRNASPYRNSLGPLPHLFAFAAGNGENVGIYNNQPDLLVKTDPDLKNASSGPAAGFWFLNGSWFSDFNLGANNLPRSILATGTSSLAVLPSSDFNLFPKWNIAELSWGKTIGEAFLTTLNYPTYATSYRWLAIQGDPTLRLNSVSPPSLTAAAVSGENVLLTWSGGETTSYYIYRAANLNGPFSSTPIATVTGAQSNYSISDDPAQRWYMLRCGKSVNSGRVTYTSLS
ncbi:MAG: hypothetical protein L0387_36995, partial [Acidobacteria bacterium]|nr:hypothetical protein [Acidobacteriota bacterium]